MKTTLTVIVDNISSDGMQGEWGLCVLVEYGDKKILLDTGASELFAGNIKKLGFELKDVDAGVLSHAHYDHGNGIPRFFKENDKAKFYLRETTAANCYHKKGIFRMYIGIPRSVVNKFQDRIEYVSGDYKLFEGVYLIPHKTPGLDMIGKRESMYQKMGFRNWKPDDFSHEQSLVLDTDKGLVILNSCSHGGAVNIINEIKETFPDKHIYGLIGGLHLFNKSSDEVRNVAKEILKTGIDYVCTGHCTKDRAYGIMKEELGDKLEQLKVGLKMEF
ncbi:MBL fold metallo-hydrolase [Butyrivibrio sp. CB08]|uniref:MBL fold metallo-hydrolase n=1 Tax=Butyrivibrio sp. CB08 TaxID=2364879 RepID=UPI000EAAA39C|nr:MBL fold metallo-hydrolase [Butyrivibrio sp. CB08]RKM59297.1 MBL fold metallo-hydrolase [Butyrivibrio sp. CB08]